jgi:VCBS repeat-containing protein
MKNKILAVLVILLMLVVITPFHSADAASSSMTIYPQKDKFVDNTGGYSSWQNGGSAWLYAGYDSSYGIERSAIGFNLSSLPDNVQTVTLNLPIYYVNNSALYQLYGSNDDSWASTGTALPGADTLINEETLPSHTTGQVYYKSVDVTSFVNAQKSGDGYASFLIQGNTSGNNFFSFHAMEDATYKPYLSVTYTMPTATMAAAQQLTEENLETTAVTITLEDVSFSDSALNPSNFTLSSGNASVSNVTWNSTTSCTLRLQNELADFDSNYSFNITINGSELSSGNDLTMENTLTVNAVNDAESISVSTDGEIARMAENGEEIEVTLSGGVFASSLNSSEWGLYNFPEGVSIGSVTRNSDTTATVTLSGNSSEGGATDITDAYISCSGSQYSDGSTTLYSGNITIETLNINPPTMVNNTGVAVNEDDEVTITSVMLTATDTDSPDETLVYTVTDTPANGQLENTDNPGVAITNFEQQDIDNNKLQYVNDGSETTSDEFTFSVSDGLNDLTGQTFSITINPVNDTPSMVNNTGETVSEGGEVNITSGALLATDPDNADETLVYTVTEAPANGQLENSENPGVAITTFTQQNIDDSKIKYVHSGTETTTDSFVFKVSDGSTELTDQTFSITINPVNDTPSMVNNTGETVNEGGEVNITSGALLATDPDNADETLVYTVTDAPANGQLENNENPGVAITTFIQQNIDDGKIKYVHSGTETTTDSFVFKVSDGSMELTEQTFTITINPVNDTPSMVNNAGETVNEGGEVSITSGVLLAMDSDNADETLVYTVTDAPANGQLENIENPGVGITTFTQQNINDGKIKYVHSGTETTADGFVFKVSDGSVELTDQTFSITINPVNDTPEILANNEFTVNENTWATIVPYFLLATDPDNDDALLQYIITTGLLNGHLENSENPGVAINTFTQQDIIDSKIIYVQDGSNTTEDYFEFDVSDGSAQLINQTFDIVIVPVDDDTPVVTTNNGSEVIQGESVKINTSMLSANDTDTKNSTLTFIITENPSNGQMENTTQPGVVISSFTQQDISDGKIIYIHDDTKTTFDSFEFYVSDGTNNSTVQTFSFTVELNQPPVRKSDVLAEKKITIKKGEVFTLALSSIFEDLDGNELNLFVSVNGGAFVPVGEIYQYTLKVDEAILVFKANDGKEFSKDTYSVTLTAEKEAVQTGSFTITLTDSKGNPLAYYPVELHSTVVTGKTDAKGQITFTNVIFENHELVIFDKDGNELGTIFFYITESDSNTTSVSGSEVFINFNESAVSLDIGISVGDDGSLVVRDIEINANPKTAGSAEIALFISEGNKQINVTSYISIILTALLISGIFIFSKKKTA